MHHQVRNEENGSRTRIIKFITESILAILKFNFSNHYRNLTFAELLMNRKIKTVLDYMVPYKTSVKEDTK